MPIYMKYEGIEGEAIGKHKGWIKFDSCQFGVNRAVTKNGIPTNEIVISKRTDSSSPRLFKESLVFKERKAIIDFVKNENEAPYLSIILENAMITSYSISGNGGGSDRPTESLSISATKITYASTPTSASKDPKQGADNVMWDMAVTQ